MSKYSINKFLKDIPVENKKGKLEVLASLLCLAVFNYIKGERLSEARSIIRDILFLGDLRNSIQWQYMEWAYFLGLYMDEVPNDNEDVNGYMRLYNRKSFEYYSANKNKFISFYSRLSKNKIRCEIKKRIRRRLSGFFLEKNMNAYEFYKQQKNIEEEWVAIIQCLLEKIYLFYTTGQVSSNDIAIFKNKAEEFICTQDYKDLAPFVPFEL